MCQPLHYEWIHLLATNNFVRLSANMNPALFFIFFFICLFFATAHGKPPSQRRVCIVRTKMLHNSVQVPFSSPIPLKVPLTLHFECNARDRAVSSATGNRPLLIIMPGALGVAANYSTLGRRLAQRRFVVAIPDYGRRRLFDYSSFFSNNLEFIRGKRRAGVLCPRRGQFPTTELINRCVSQKKVTGISLRAYREVHLTDSSFSVPYVYICYWESLAYSNSLTQLTAAVLTCGRSPTWKKLSSLVTLWEVQCHNLFSVAFALLFLLLWTLRRAIFLRILGCCFAPFVNSTLLLTLQIFLD